MTNFVTIKIDQITLVNISIKFTMSQHFCYSSLSDKTFNFLKSWYGSWMLGKFSWTVDKLIFTNFFLLSWNGMKCNINILWIILLGFNETGFEDFNLMLLNKRTYYLKKNGKFGYSEKLKIRIEPVKISDFSKNLGNKHSKLKGRLR